MTPLITVVIAVYNGRKTLCECLDSVLAQTFKGIELVVVDGGSNDGTKELLQSYSGYLAYWKSEPDEGIYDAWNKALTVARGQWICFLGADDYFWDREAVGRLVPTLLSAWPEYRFVYGDIHMVSSRGEVVETLGSSWASAKASMRYTMCLPHVGMMHHRSLFEERGVFDTSFKIAGDYELLRRELIHRDALYIQGTVAGQRYGGVSTKTEHIVRAMKENGRAIRKQDGSIPIQWYWLLLTAIFKARAYDLFGVRGGRRIVDIYRLLTGRKPRGMKF